MAFAGSSETLLLVLCDTVVGSFAVEVGDWLEVDFAGRSEDDVEEGVIAGDDGMLRVV